MLQKLDINQHKQPFQGPFAITRVFPGKILNEHAEDNLFSPLSNIDHATMKKGLTIKMHQHINDEILSYVWKGVSHHKDSAGIEEPISRGKLMLMNAGEGFWHEEKVKKDEVEMLQIFVRPEETDLPPEIQFHDKPTHNRDWYLMVGPKGSQAPLFVRQQVYILDAHPVAGDKLDVPVYEDFTPFLYVMQGEVTVDNTTIRKQEAITDMQTPLPPIQVTQDATLILFFVKMGVPMTLDGTISGLQDEYEKRGRQ